MRPPRFLLLVLVSGLAALGCRSAAPEVIPRALPTDWLTRSPFAFEQLVLERLPDERPTRLALAERVELRHALAGPVEGAVRAAVVLGRSRTRGAEAILLERLEARVPAEARSADAGDVVAAAALGRSARLARYAPRLAALASGPAPHPDLEVRVECACSALDAGRSEVIPFLLQVLRIDTWDGQADARDFEVTPTTAWPRTRAAEALSRRAGVPVTYLADGPIGARQDEARKLARLLGR